MGKPGKHPIVTARFLLHFHNVLLRTKHLALRILMLLIFFQSSMNQLPRHGAWEQCANSSLTYIKVLPVDLEYATHLHAIYNVVKCWPQTIYSHI